MKKSKLLTMFMIVNLLCIIWATVYLPDIVVFNINAKFQITEFVGKWYNIILPILAIISCSIIMFIDFKENGTRKHVYRYLIAYVAVAVCSYYSWVLIGVQFNGGLIGDAIKAPWTIIILFPIAYFMLANGISLRDRIFKDASLFKLKMTLSNPIVWQKTHTMAGRTSILTGLVFFVIAVCNELFWHTLWVYVVALAVWFVVAYLFVLL